MNMNSYRKHVTAVHNAAESVASDNMSKAANEVKKFYRAGEDGIYNIGVLGDGIKGSCEPTHDREGD